MKCDGYSFEGRSVNRGRMNHMSLCALKFELAPAEMTDLEQIMEIEQVSFPFPWTNRMFFHELSNDSLSFAYVVRDVDGKIIGYVFMKALLDELHLLNIAVDPQWRRKGLGKVLIERVLNTVEEKRMERVILEVRVSNQPALDLYRKFGFKRVCIRRNYYCRPTENALLLQYNADLMKAPGPGL